MGDFTCGNIEGTGGGHGYLRALGHGSSGGQIPYGLLTDVSLQGVLGGKAGILTLRIGHQPLKQLPGVGRVWGWEVGGRR